MADKLDFEVKISGTREGKPLTPAALDVDEWIGAMQSARDILYPEGKHTARISVRMEEGSARLILTAEAKDIIPTQALLAELDKSHKLNLLQQKQIDAIHFFQQLANNYQWSFLLGAKKQIEKGLHIDRSTEGQWQTDDPVWVDAELYLTGRITNIGGKTTSNIHLDTDEFNLGSVIINASRKQLAEDEKNRLYKKQQVHVRIKQNAETGAYDTKTSPSPSQSSFLVPRASPVMNTS